jgi:pyrimidine operon attenuation protein/uracil phosphoribosyltransferase
MPSRTIIKTHNDIKRMLQRLSYEIAESFFSADEIYLVALNHRGLSIANEINQDLTRILPNCTISLGNVDVIGDFTWSGVAPSQVSADIPVVIIDDVIHSGSTVMKVLMALYDHGFKTIRTAFLADRQYRNYPVSADFIGVSLSTTLQEHVFFDNSDPGELLLFLE